MTFCHQLWAVSAQQEEVSHARFSLAGPPGAPLRISASAAGRNNSITAITPTTLPMC